MSQAGRAFGLLGALNPTNLGYDNHSDLLSFCSRNVVRYPVRHTRGVRTDVGPIDHCRCVPVLDEQLRRQRAHVRGARPEGVRLQDGAGHFLRRFLPTEWVRDDSRMRRDANNE